MISEDEIEEFGHRFGVAEAQVERDHFISHVLSALGSMSPEESDDLVFFGGTALCRTWLPDLRLSEDIDLLVDSTKQGEELRRGITLGLRLEFRKHDWTYVSSIHDVETWNLSSGDLVVKVQFAEWRPRWKDAINRVAQPVELRYSDLPKSVSLVVPTPSSFAAMKLLAWHDRSAARDIFDLAALAEAKMIDAEALDTFERVIGYKPSATMIANVPIPRVQAEWETELDHQLENPRSLDECIALVQAAVEGALGHGAVTNFP